MGYAADQKDLLFVAQNSGEHAGKIVAGLLNMGQITEADVTERFDLYRKVIFHGALELAGLDYDDILSGAATQRVEQAFGGNAQSSPQGNGGGGGGGGTAPAVKIIKMSVSDGKPDWLDAAFAELVSKGEVAASDNEVWDNRDKLPKFGGQGNPRAPWFRTSKGKVSIWPPRGQG